MFPATLRTINMKKLDYEEDDGRVVADMSGLEDHSLAGEWFGRRFFNYRKKDRTPAEQENMRRPDEDQPDALPPRTDMTPTQKRAAIFGTLKASLLVGMVYVVAFAIFIALLLLFWR